MNRIAILELLVAALVAAAPVKTVVLNGTGLTAAGKKLVFDKTPRTEAIAAVIRVLGKPTKSGSYGDCGQGSVIAYAKFKGGFELSFIRGKLSGWTEEQASLATDRGIRVDATLAALRKAYPDVDTDPGDEANGGVGPSFQREGGPNGWLSGVKPNSKIAGMFAGATCLPGV